MHLPSTDGPGPFTGDLEAHLTAGGGPDVPRRLAGWAAAAGVKYTHIVLDRGRTPSQPMVTLRRTGTLAAMRDAARAQVNRLADAGFPVIRVKIEADVRAAGVPRHAAQAQRLGPGRYFEHHIKLALPAGADLAALARAVVRQGAHLSRNARRGSCSDGVHQRFVTQRCHGVGDPEAARRLAVLLGVLDAMGHRRLSVEREFVLQDSDPAVDDGWITMGGDR